MLLCAQYGLPNGATEWMDTHVKQDCSIAFYFSTNPHSQYN